MLSSQAVGQNVIARILRFDHGLRSGGGRWRDKIKAVESVEVVEAVVSNEHASTDVRYRSKRYIDNSRVSTVTTDML